MATHSEAYALALHIARRCVGHDASNGARRVERRLRRLLVRMMQFQMHDKTTTHANKFGTTHCQGNVRAQSQSRASERDVEF